MFDFGLFELVVIGVVALVVVGPERLPKVARTLGHLVGRMQRYVNDVKADIQREVELDELRKLRDEVESSARSIEQSVTDGLQEAQSGLREAEAGLRDLETSFGDAGEQARAAFETESSTGALPAAQPLADPLRPEPAVPLVEPAHGPDRDAVSPHRFVDPSDAVAAHVPPAPAAASLAPAPASTPDPDRVTTDRPAG